MSAAHDLWRYAPKVEAGGGTRRHWIIVQEPGCVPDKKGAFSFGDITPFLRELKECRPEGTQYTVVSLTWDFDIWVESGRQWLETEDVYANLEDEAAA